MATRIRCPYGQPGDRLWVRETWAAFGVREIPKERGCHVVIYREDEEPVQHAYGWRPSIHMPRWASRITLEVTDVRVERVQDITLDDVNAEGVSESRTTFIDEHNARGHFADTWNNLNAKRGFSWDSNPWVWCVTFKQLKQETLCDKS